MANAQKEKVVNRNGGSIQWLPRICSRKAIFPGGRTSLADCVDSSRIVGKADSPRLPQIWSTWSVVALLIALRKIWWFWLRGGGEFCGPPRKYREAHGDRAFWEVNERAEWMDKRQSIASANRNTFRYQLELTLNIGFSLYVNYLSLIGDGNEICRCQIMNSYFFENKWGPIENW